MDRIKIARNAILAELQRRGKEGDPSVKPAKASDLHRWHMPQSNYYSGSGKVLCPVCNKGLLNYSRSSYNGHVHARCSIDGCVAWME